MFKYTQAIGQKLSVICLTILWGCRVKGYRVDPNVDLLIKHFRQMLLLISMIYFNFVKFTGKHLCQSLFFDKVAGLRPATIIKKRLWHRCFSVNFVTFLRTPILTKICERLLLKTILHKIYKISSTNTAQKMNFSI